MGEEGTRIDRDEAKLLCLLQVRHTTPDFPPPRLENPHPRETGCPSLAFVEGTTY
jgi:hypothetical protein